MLKTDRLKSLVVLLVAGFIGGAVSRTVMDAIPRASAQREKAGQVITAGRFVLVDEQGNTRAALYTDTSYGANSKVPSVYTFLEFYDDKQNSMTTLETDGTDTQFRLGRKPIDVYLYSYGGSKAGLKVEGSKKVEFSAP